VAFDIARCIELSGVAPEALALAGGATVSPWAEIVTAVAGAPGVVRASREAASAGAFMVTAHALGRAVDPDACNPVAAVVTPPPDAVSAYRGLRAASDAAAAALLPTTGVTA
jgi:sugar (pentulose or hexulose) kinase